MVGPGKALEEVDVEDLDSWVFLTNPSSTNVRENEDIQHPNEVDNAADNVIVISVLT